MRRFKKILCVFLAVIILFFSVNNSHFSPHKMDNVEAASIVLGSGVVITVDFVLKVIASIVVTGISIGLINEWMNMDMEELLEDFHDWLGENISILDSIGIDGTSALKEWAQTDEWTVIVGGAGSPEPSPSPDDDGHHGLANAFKIAGASAVGGVTLASVLTPLVMTNEAGQYQDAEGNILDANDPRIASVTIDETYAQLAAAYIADKIANYGSVEDSTDPIVNALQNRYQPALIELPEGYSAWSTAQIVKWNAENLGYQANSASFTYINNEKTYKSEIIYTNPVYFIPVITKEGHYSIKGITFEDNSYTFTNYVDGVKSTSLTQTVTVGDANFVISGGVNCLNIYTHLSNSSPISFYQITDSSEINAIKKIGLGLSKDDLLSPYYKNYIDTDDEFGWASTAQLSPAELLAHGYGIDMLGMNNFSDLLESIIAYPALAPVRTDRDYSLPGIKKAIDAITNKLEEQNPNSDPAVDPIVYPDVNTYYITYENVVTDPEVFPETSPGTDTGTNPDIETDAGTSTSPNYSVFLQTIINILQGIWDLLKDFLAWFIIDFPTIKEHLLSALTNIPEYDVFEPIIGYFDYFRTAINDSYDYPVISITTPDILLPYYKQPEIILVDFEDYAKYFVWARAIISFSLYFGFGLWLIKDIKVFFSGL